MMDPGDAAAERRKQAHYARPAPWTSTRGSTAVATTARKKSAFERLAEKTGATSRPCSLSSRGRAFLFRRAPTIRGHPRAVGDERLADSASHTGHAGGSVHRNGAGGGVPAIRRRQPDFNINGFLAEVRRDVPAVLGAYLKGDLEALRRTPSAQRCWSAWADRCACGRANSSSWTIEMRTSSELELVEGAHDRTTTTLVVLQFSCQQINCVRNERGAFAIDGAEDDIQAVHGLWAMQLSPDDFVAPDGRRRPRRRGATGDGRHGHDGGGGVRESARSSRRPRRSYAPPFFLLADRRSTTVLLTRHHTKTTTTTSRLVQNGEVHSFTFPRIFATSTKSRRSRSSSRREVRPPCFNRVGSEATRRWCSRRRRLLTPPSVTLDVTASGAFATNVPSSLYTLTSIFSSTGASCSAVAFTRSPPPRGRRQTSRRKTPPRTCAPCESMSPRASRDPRRDPHPTA